MARFSLAISALLLLMIPLFAFFNSFKTWQSQKASDFVPIDQIHLQSMLFYYEGVGLDPLTRLTAAEELLDSGSQELKEKVDKSVIIGFLNYPEEGIRGRTFQFLAQRFPEDFAIEAIIRFEGETPKNRLTILRNFLKIEGDFREILIDQKPLSLYEARYLAELHLLKKEFQTLYIQQALQNLEKQQEIEVSFALLWGIDHDFDYITFIEEKLDYAKLKTSEQLYFLDWTRELGLPLDLQKNWRKLTYDLKVKLLNEAYFACSPQRWEIYKDLVKEEQDPVLLQVLVQLLRREESTRIEPLLQSLNRAKGMDPQILRDISFVLEDHRVFKKSARCSPLKS